MTARATRRKRPAARRPKSGLPPAQGGSERGAEEPPARDSAGRAGPRVVRDVSDPSPSGKPPTKKPRARKARSASATDAASGGAPGDGKPAKARERVSGKRNRRRGKSQPDSAPAARAASGAGAAPAEAAAKPRRERGAASETAGTVSAPPREPASDVQEQLYEIQENLDALLRDVDHAHGDADARRRAAEAIGHIAARLDPDGAQRVSRDAEAWLGTARQLLSPDYYARQWSRIGMRHRSEEVDDFGLDTVYEERVQPALDALFERYFRVQVYGMEHIPTEGPAMLVCNRGGALPWDGLMLKTAVRNHHVEARRLRWLTEDFNFHAPFLGPFLNRIGAVRACQANAERLLDQGSLLAVFPEGIKGVAKNYSQRYQLQRFARGGHVKLSLRRGVPMIPVAIVGAEEAYPLLFRFKWMVKAMGLPFVPVTPTFPLLGPAGLLPLPSRWRIVAGPPLDGVSGLSPDSAEDTVLVNELNERLRLTVQRLLDDARAARGQRALF